MLIYIAKRVLIVIPISLGLSAIVFLAMHLLPGDPIQIWIGLTVTNPNQIAFLQHQLGLDQPLYTQYLVYLSRLLQGNMGFDLRTGQPVVEEVMQAFLWTLQLAIAAEIIAVSIGLLAGIYAAKKQNSWVDAGIMSSSLWLASMPSFWLGLVLILIFSAWLKLTPISGYGGLEYLILPAFALGLGQMGILARFTRSSFLDVIRQDYIRAAKARGLSDRMVTFQHALRNAFAPIITVVGLQLGYLLGGAFFVEIIFGWPGVGRLAFRAISERNYPLLQGAVLVVSVSFVLINAAVDIIHAYVDPRVQSDINREAA